MNNHPRTGPLGNSIALKFHKLVGGKEASGVRSVCEKIRRQTRTLSSWPDWEKKKSITANLSQHNKKQNSKQWLCLPICVSAPSVPLSRSPACIQTGQRAPAHREEGWMCVSLLPSLSLSVTSFVIREGNTFSLGLLVYWFLPLFGELGTKTEFVLSWPPASSPNAPPRLHSLPLLLSRSASAQHGWVHYICFLSEWVHL